MPILRDLKHAGYAPVGEQVDLPLAFLRCADGGAYAAPKHKTFDILH